MFCFKKLYIQSSYITSYTTRNCVTTPGPKTAPPLVVDLMELLIVVIVEFSMTHTLQRFT